MNDIIDKYKEIHIYNKLKHRHLNKYKYRLTRLIYSIKRLENDFHARLIQGLLSLRKIHVRQDIKPECSVTKDRIRYYESVVCSYIKYIFGV